MKATATYGSDLKRTTFTEFGDQFILQIYRIFDEYAPEA
jgi:hypothetical protein